MTVELETQDLFSGEAGADIECLSCGEPLRRGRCPNRCDAEMEYAVLVGTRAAGSTAESCCCAHNYDAEMQPKRRTSHVRIRPQRKRSKFETNGH